MAIPKSNNRCGDKKDDKVLNLEVELKKLEKDIWQQSRHYNINGFDADDLYQEFQISIWKALPKYRGDNGATIRGFAYEVIRIRVLELARTTYTKKRRANNGTIRLDELEDNDIDIEDKQWPERFGENFSKDFKDNWL